jgi:hypothetical protein
MTPFDCRIVSGAKKGDSTRPGRMTIVPMGRGAKRLIRRPPGNAANRGQYSSSTKARQVGTSDQLKRVEEKKTIIKE